MSVVATVGKVIKPPGASLVAKEELVRLAVVGAAKEGRGQRADVVEEVAMGRPSRFMALALTSMVAAAAAGEPTMALVLLVGILMAGVVMRVVLVLPPSLQTAETEVTHQAPPLMLRVERGTATKEEELDSLAAVVAVRVAPHPMVLPVAPVAALVWRAEPVAVAAVVI
jgi:hypothetical protein